MAGVVKLLEVNAAALVCSTVPPVRAEYQVNVPDAVLVAESVTVPAPQRAPAVGVGATGNAFTVAVMAVRGVLSHVPLWKVT
jgi:hypothetical protein